MEPKKFPKKSHRVGGRDLKESYEIYLPKSVWKQQILPTQNGKHVIFQNDSQKVTWLLGIFGIFFFRNFGGLKQKGWKKQFFFKARLLNQLRGRFLASRCDREQGDYN